MDEQQGGSSIDRLCAVAKEVHSSFLDLKGLCESDDGYGGSELAWRQAGVVRVRIAAYHSILSDLTRKKPLKDLPKEERNRLVPAHLLVEEAVSYVRENYPPLREFLELL